MNPQSHDFDGAVERNLIPQSQTEIKKPFDPKLGAQLRNQLGNQLRAQLGNRLGAQLREQLGAQLGDQLEEFHDPKTA